MLTINEEFQEKRILIFIFSVQIQNSSLQSSGSSSSPPRINVDRARSLTAVFPLDPVFIDGGKNPFVLAGALRLRGRKQVLFGREPADPLSAWYGRSPRVTVLQGCIPVGIMLLCTEFTQHVMQTLPIL